MSEIIICQVPITDDCPSGTMIVVPAEGLKPEDVLKNIPPQTISYRITERSKVPQDRTFRNAWTDEYETDTVDVHMDRAREIHKNTLRTLRKPQLEKLDAEFLKALEDGDVARQAEVKSKKQELRDVTKHPDVLTASTPEELKNAIPEILR